jgi:tRNA A-37 threonylcarbamoyl transferase component Bud32
MTRFGSSIEVYKQCSDHGICPHFVCYKTVGRWGVLVTEYVYGETVDIALRKLPDKQQQQALLKKVEKVGNEMHQLRIVHGDLRVPNILISREERVYLIDLDFAGEEGKAVYPLFLNEQIQWPDGVEANKPITKAHDRYWLEGIAILYLKDAS